MKSPLKHLTKPIVLSLVKIVAIGIFIGYFHEHHKVIAILLGIKIAYDIYFKIYKKNNLLLLYGMVLTGLIGTGSEHIGVSYGYWEYHDIDTYIPYWVPLAWASAFSFLYKLESKTIQFIASPTSRKIVNALFLTIFPTIGEIITIKLGVWTYHIPYKILGVPLLAIFGLWLLHTIVQQLLKVFCSKINLSDPIYN